MPNLPEHPFDSVAAEIARWVNDEASWYSTALTQGYQTPFSANVTESDKLAYYRRQMYKTGPDGEIDYNTPNTEGRNALFKRVTADQYVEIARAVAPGRGPEHIQRLSLEMPQGDLTNAESQSGY